MNWNFIKLHVFHPKKNSIFFKYHILHDEILYIYFYILDNKNIYKKQNNCVDNTSTVILKLKILCKTAFCLQKKNSLKTIELHIIQIITAGRQSYKSKQN